MRYPAVPYPLQRGHLLMLDRNRDSRAGVYAHPIAPASNDLGSGKLLLQMPKDWPGADGTPACDNKTRWLFVPVPHEEETAARVRRVPHEQGSPRVFSYATPVSIFKKAKNAPAVSPPLARYFEGQTEL